MKCEKCGAVAKEYREGHSRGWICDVCGWGCVTTYYEPYETDMTTYSIVIYDNEVCVNKIKVIARITGVNYLKAKTLLESNEAIVFSGNAKEIFEVKKILLDNAIIFKVTPEFPY